MAQTIARRYSLQVPLIPDVAACLLSPEPAVAFADDLEEDESLPAPEYKKLILRKACRCVWEGSNIPNFLAFLNTFAQ